MSVTYSSSVVFGKKLTISEITIKVSKNCSHEFSTPFCPNCGAPASKKDVFLLQDLIDEGEINGISYFMQWDEAPEIYVGYILAEASVEKPKVLFPELTKEAISKLVLFFQERGLVVEESSFQYHLVVGCA